MTNTDTYDVAVIGYGPTGATAANLLGQLGLKVLVIERDPDVYSRARAISTDEEVMRIWQSVGLDERLQRDMLPDRPLTFVDADNVPFIDLKVHPRGAGHPPQQFLYQPAVDHVLRDGVERFANVDVLLEHECLRVHPEDDRVELMLADLRTDTLKRLHAGYVIAADGGSSPTRGQLGIGYTGRTYSERWVVIDTKVLREWEGHDRLRFHCNPDRPTVDCPTPLGHHRWEYPARAGELEQELLRRRGDLEGPERSGHHRRERRDSAGRDLQPPRPRRRPLAGGPGLPGRRCRARDAAVDRPGHVGRCSRRRQPVLEARRRGERASSGVAARYVPS